MFTKTKGFVDFKEIIIHMACSVRYFSFHSKQWQPFSHCPRIQIKSETKGNMMNFAYVTIKLVKYFPFSALNHLKLDFPNKITFLHLSSANWIFTIKHVHFTDVTGSGINLTGMSI